MIQAFGGNRTSGPIDVTPSLLAQPGSGYKGDFDSETFVAEVAGTLPAGGAQAKSAGTATGQDAAAGLLVAHSLRGEGFKASEDGTGRGTPLVAVPFDTTQITSSSNYSVPKAGDPCHPLAAGAHPPAVAFRYNMGGNDGGIYSDGSTATLTVESHPAVAFQTRGSNLAVGEISGTIGTNADRASGSAPMVAHAFDARQSDVIQYGNKTGPLDTDGHTIGVFAFSAKDHGGDATHDLAPTMRAMAEGGGNANGGEQLAVAFQSSQSGVRVADTHPTLDANNGSRRHNGVAASMAVRRLTPRECERLQGFPDDYTRIPWRKKPPEECADGPRYKALGNSMAVPCMRWIGRRVAAELARQVANPTTSN